MVPGHHLNDRVCADMNYSCEQIRQKIVELKGETAITLAPYGASISTLNWLGTIRIPTALVEF